jgi:hypothetical protein
MSCEYCADTRIDGLTLRRMGIELPCRYCEPTAMQPDRIEMTDDHILAELLNERLLPAGEDEDV